MIRSDEFPVPHAACWHPYLFPSRIRVRLCPCMFSHMEKASVNEHNSLLVWTLERGRTVENEASWGHNKHTNREAVEPVTYLAALVKQPVVKCFQFDTRKGLILRNEEPTVM